MGLKSSKKVEVNRYELEIEVSAEEFAKAVEKAYLKQIGKITVPGFRKGKAPRKFIEKYYGEQVFYEDAINVLYGPEINKAVKEANLEMIDDKIDFDIVKIGKEEGLTFKVKITVMPEVKLGNYKEIEIPKISVSRVTVKDIDERLKLIQSQNARLVTSEDGTAEEGDVATVSFEGFIDSKHFDGGTAEDIELEIGKGRFIAGFEDQVIGHKVGQEFEIKVTFPSEYHVLKLAGKDAVFKTKLVKLQKKDLPALDDEFIKDISDFETLEDFKKDLKKKISEEHKENASREVQREAMEKFASLVEVEIPEALIKNKSIELLREFEYKLRAQNLTLEDYISHTGLKIEQLLENVRPEAEHSVKMNLGLQEVAKLENIEISSEEIEKEYELICKLYSIKIDQAKKMVSEDLIKHDLLLKKASELIVSNVIKK